MIGPTRLALGYSITPATRAKLVASRAKQNAKMYHADCQVAWKALRPSNAVDVSRSAFGGGKSVNEFMIIDDDVLYMDRDDKNDHRLRACQSRALVSHVRAQAEGLCSFLRPEGGQVEHMFTTNIFDDASMWVQRPTIPSLPDAADANRRVDSWLSKRGKSFIFLFLI